MFFYPFMAFTYISGALFVFNFSQLPQSIHGLARSLKPAVVMFFSGLIAKKKHSIMKHVCVFLTVLGIIKFIEKRLINNIYNLLLKGLILLAMRDKKVPNIEMNSTKDDNEADFETLEISRIFILFSIVLDSVTCAMQESLSSVYTGSSKLVCAFTTMFHMNKWSAVFLFICKN